MTRGAEKALTLSLGGACAAFFAFAVAMQLGLGRGYHWSEDGVAAGEPVAGAAIDKQQFELPPQSQFAVIGERPVFNEDRKPAPEDPTVDTSGAPPPSPLNISLTGTVLVGKPPVRIAMVRENGKATTISLKEGMPLPGDQAAWTLSQVKNRSAVFKSSTGEEVEVELAVASAGQKPNPAATAAHPGTPAPPHAAATPPPNPVAAQSEELQHRIEERRKQMREAAERMKTQRPPDPNQPQQQQQ